MLVIERSLSKELESLPLSSYKKILTEKREIPKEELNNELEIKKLFDPDTECDFYYPDMVLK